MRLAWVPHFGSHTGLPAAKGVASSPEKMHNLLVRREKTMRKTFTLFLVLALVLLAAGVVNASTSAEKQAAIDQ